ncbi:Phosphatase dcr2 [Malassezia nana]|uniref:Phosphatase dcr2 n=1 Tax=Malassezia nana TaxID=180528 RepID=A0AAF0EMC1_9BASI|nr:Phosphatase dcr2 [Malassezia nana]
MTAVVWVLLFWALYATVSHYMHAPIAPRVGQPGRPTDLETYEPLLSHDRPLYNVTVAYCQPRGGCTLPRISDDHAGPWVRVDRPLTAKTARQLGAWNTFGKPLYGRFVFYRRALTTHSVRIIDIFAATTAKRPNGTDWERVREPLVAPRAHHPGVYLYIRKAPASAPDVGVTELSVHYGHHTPLPGFVAAGTIEPAHRLHSRKAKVTLLARHGPLPRVPRPTLRFRADGTFKILQIADLHLSVLEEPCRDVEDRASCQSHNHTVARIEAWLDAEKPDLVVLTGDQWNGQGTSWDERSATPLWVDPLVRRRIPWIPVLGNHDSESGFFSRTEQMLFLAQLPYSLAEAGAHALHGAGNYQVPVYAASNNTEAWTMYALDSGANAPFSLWHLWQSALYDWG